MQLGGPLEFTTSSTTFSHPGPGLQVTVYALRQGFWDTPTGPFSLEGRIYLVSYLGFQCLMNLPIWNSYDLCIVFLFFFQAMVSESCSGHFNVFR